MSRLLCWACMLYFVYTAESDTGWIARWVDRQEAVLIKAKHTTTKIEKLCWHMPRRIPFGIFMTFSSCLVAMRRHIQGPNQTFITTIHSTRKRLVDEHNAYPLGLVSCILVASQPIGIHWQYCIVMSLGLMQGGARLPLAMGLSCRTLRQISCLGRLSNQVVRIIKMFTFKLCPSRTFSIERPPEIHSSPVYLS